jgi:site-specific DNA recombinase
VALTFDAREAPRVALATTSVQCRSRQSKRLCCAVSKSTLARRSCWRSTSRSFTAPWLELRDTAHDRRAELSKRLNKIEKAINAIVDVIAEGQSSRALTERLADLERDRDLVEAAICEAVSPPIALHPDAAESYRERVKDLKAALNAADEENRTMAYEAIRELLEVVVIRPEGPYKPVEIDIYGRIQSLLPQNKTGPESMGVLVAGVGFEPTTFRL